MKDLDKFSDEEKKHLSYLGSMLSKPLNDFDAEVQRILDLAGDYPNRNQQPQEERPGS
jgi:hypothetical protein